jgi:Transmembrane domain of unknown function (DUF3566)
MTETQAAADARANARQADGEASAVPVSAPPGGSMNKSGGSPADPGGGHASGRATVVGRATVPGDTGGSPRYTRAPGMPPPPDSLVPPQGAKSDAPVSIGGVPVGKAPLDATSQVGSGAGGRGVARGAATVGRKIAGLTTGPVTGSARVTEAVRATRATVSSAAGRGPRRARLHIKRIDPWSTMKFAFAVSLVLFVVAIVATSVLYLALQTMGVWDAVNKALAQMVGNSGGQAGATFRITAKGIIGGSALLGAVNVVLFTALATLGAFIYNVCADLVGGIELTLAEKE